MANSSILHFVYFLTAPKCFAFPAAINFLIPGLFFKRANILYIYTTLILEPIRSSHGISVPLINHYCLKKLIALWKRT
jgi:hypothetical protein